MNCKITPVEGLREPTTLSTIPGDKSLSHRAAIFGALALGKSSFQNFLFSEDCLNTVRILSALGCSFSMDKDKKTICVEGVGLTGFRSSSNQLDVGNSGTAIRLLSGVLGCQSFDSTISGDSSIEKRPMKRISEPLSKMGIVIDGIKKNGNVYPPLQIKSASKLSGMTYELPVASAQVKSAILLASLYSDEETTIIEPEKCRDHTERFLSFYGADFREEGTHLICSGKKELKAPFSDSAIYLPSDISSAAFFIVLGCCTGNGLKLEGIGLNPTRDAILSVLKRMGANIKITRKDNGAVEPYGDIEVRPARLVNVELKKEEIPFLIDEIPILAIASLFAEGTFVVRNAEELRVKESDRVSTVVNLIRSMGGNIEEFEDGFCIDGNKTSFKPFKLDSHGDHRIAMSGIIGAFSGGVPATVTNCTCINTSFPNFFELIDTLFPNSFVIQ